MRQRWLFGDVPDVRADMAKSFWVKFAFGILVTKALFGCSGDDPGHTDRWEVTGGSAAKTGGSGASVLATGGRGTSSGYAGSSTEGGSQSTSGTGIGGDTRAVSGGTARATVIGSGGSTGTPVSVPATCKDGLRNGNEVDVDCGGGNCPTCGTGSECSFSKDCSSLVCIESVCVAASCDDDTMNGDETDVDCGGSCSSCAPGKICKGVADCNSRVCSRTCLAPTCTDKVKNGTEADVDCGGTCASCSVGKSCAQGKDCLSHLCVDATCTKPSCDDGVQNGTETDVDCGGTCSGCVNERNCSSHADCRELFCVENQCAHPTCNDTLQNGTETDTDCGGSCAGCSATRRCKVNNDCAKGYCYFGRCPTATVEVEAGRVFEVGVGPLTAFNGVQLQPDRAEELVVGISGERGYSVLSGGKSTGFTKLERFPGELALPQLVRDIDGDGLTEVMFSTQYEQYGNYLPLGWKLGRFVNGALTTLDSGTEVLEDFDFADINQDGAVDLLFVWGAFYDYRSKLMVRLGDGIGKFGAAQVAFTANAANGFPSNGYIFRFEVFNANGDEFPDLLITNGQSSPLTVFSVLGDGLGGFRAPAQKLVDMSSQLWATEDFDDDGIDDLVSGYGDKKLSFGVGDGTFFEPLAIPSEADDQVAVYDVDGDGIPEIIIGDNELTFWKLEAATVVPVATLNVATTFRVAPSFGDFDGNGLVDIAVPQNGRTEDNPGTGANVAIYYQKAPFEFVAHRVIKGAHSLVYWVTVGDVDGNGSDDVVSVYNHHNSDEPPTVGPGISLFTGATQTKQSELDFTALDPIGNGIGSIGKFNGESGTTGDFNGDGRLDIAMDAWNHSVVLLQSDTGSFVLSKELKNTRSILAIDLNGDKLSELILANTRTIDVYKADGKGSLVLDYSLNFGEDNVFARLSSGDINGDGRPDVLLTGYSSVMSKTSGGFINYDWDHVSRTWVMKNDGSGRLTVPTPIAHHPYTFTGKQYDYGGSLGATVGDFDGDGVSDLSIVYVEFGQYTIYFSQGPGGPAKSIDCDVLLHPMGIVAYDWNGDGRDDLAVSNYSSSALSLMQSVGRDRCPELNGHYRLGRKPFNVALLGRSALNPPAIAASGYLGLQILPFRRNLL